MITALTALDLDTGIAIAVDVAVDHEATQCAK